MIATFTTSNMVTTIRLSRANSVIARVEVKRRLFVPFVIFSQSPIVYVKMRSIHWLEMKPGTNRRFFTSDIRRALPDHCEYNLQRVSTVQQYCSLHAHVVFSCKNCLARVMYIHEIKTMGI